VKNRPGKNIIAAQTIITASHAPMFHRITFVPSRGPIGSRLKSASQKFMMPALSSTLNAKSFVIRAAMANSTNPIMTFVTGPAMLIFPSFSTGMLCANMYVAPGAAKVNLPPEIMAKTTANIRPWFHALNSAW